MAIGTIGEYLYKTYDFKYVHFCQGGGVVGNTGELEETPRFKGGMRQTFQVRVSTIYVRS